MNLAESDDGVTRSLATAHDAVTARHEESRTRLLCGLPDELPAPRSTQSASALRYVLGGLGLSAVVAAVMLTLWLLAPISPAVAMERMTKALDSVTTYSFRMESVYTSRAGKGRTVREVQVGQLRTAPLGLRASVRIVETPETNAAAAGDPKTLVHIKETHAAGKRGIIVDHLNKQYWWIDEQLDAQEIPGGSTQVLIYKVRQRRGRVLRDLGQRKIAGRLARGLEIQLDDGDPVTDLGPASAADDVGQAAGWDWRNVKVTVWVDPTTDLPIEFRCTRRGDDFERTYVVTDLKWNVPFGKDAFDAVAPSGYKKLDESPWVETE